MMPDQQPRGAHLAPGTPRPGWGRDAVGLLHVPGWAAYQRQLSARGIGKQAQPICAGVSRSAQEPGATWCLTARRPSTQSIRGRCDSFSGSVLVADRQNRERKTRQRGTEDMEWTHVNDVTWKLTEGDRVVSTGGYGLRMKGG